ncbi:antibiotic biosynthesis monooxygenase family protein [Lysobacter antibioticus]|uniref:antibiotic biosynthesis monooxygenase family protein n=1 Tax=Lysobacter antibioticus TaxID=84531 RepID=UPI00071748E2|nr:antibiotic biosynthesis monooxygenase family protein [Lysobacter antibioticus]ALN64956.1 antibiotic biosynthesis monooxygenase family protein [Lysobacter antibioticus]
MIVEYIRYTLEPDACEAFERDYARAAVVLDASRHCLAYELSRCVDEPHRYLLRIEWDSAQGHLQGFRGSPEFREFLAAIRGYIGAIEEMRHYAPTAVVGAKAATA